MAFFYDNLLEIVVDFLIQFIFVFHARGKIKKVQGAFVLTTEGILTNAYDVLH